MPSATLFRSTDGFGIGTDPAVGVDVDGVYAERCGDVLLPVTDVEGIGVLKGPQGTLFGRNTAAGAISIITRKPGNEQEARAKLRLGNYGKQYFEAMFNQPVGDDSAFRINGLFNHRSEERRLGKACVRPCRSRWSPYP